MPQLHIWQPRRADPRLVEGERYRISHPRIPRDNRLFKTDSDMRSEGWEPVKVGPVLRRFFIGMGAIALAMLALHVLGRIGGLQ